jgi:hypothetical protein
MGLPGTHASCSTDPTATINLHAYNSKRETGLLVIVRLHTTQTAEPAPTAARYRQPSAFQSITRAG